MTCKMRPAKSSGTGANLNVLSDSDSHEVWCLYHTIATVGRQGSNGIVTRMQGRCTICGQRFVRTFDRRTGEVSEWAPDTEGTNE